jgi:hypothetical protein
MLILSKDGKLVEINRKDFLTDSEYYNKIISLKFNFSLDTHAQKQKQTINKNNLISMIRKTTCM